MKPAELLSKLNAILNQSPERSYHLKWGAVFGGILAVFVAVLYPVAFNYSKANLEAQDYRASIKRMESLDVTASNYARRLDEIKRNADLESSRYVKQADIPSVISHVSDVARVHQVTLRKINSLPAAAAAAFPDTTRLPLSMEVTGGYQQVAEFLGSLGTSIPWFFTWDRIKIRSPRLDGAVEGFVELGFYSRQS